MRMKRAAAVAVMVALALLAAGSVGAGAARQAGPSVVCGAWFKALPSGWEQSGSLSGLVIGRSVPPSGPTTWAGTPRAAFHPAEKLPRNGIGIWIDFQRPKGGPSGGALRLPLRLRNATVIEQKGAVAGLPEYLLYGRYKHPYNARVAVDFGRTSPSGRLRRVADRVLRKSFSHVGCPSGDAPPARQSVRRPPSSGVIPEH
jgi:hypothetical protein